MVYIPFVVKSANGLSVVRANAGSIIIVDDCETRSVLTLEDMKSMSFDQGQSTVKRLGKILKVRNGSKSETDLFIVNSWQGVIDRANELDRLFRVASKGKGKAVVFFTGEHYHAKAIHAGDCFMLGDLRDLGSQDMTVEMAKTLTKEEMCGFMMDKGHPGFGLLKLPKTVLLDDYIGDYMAFLQNFIDNAVRRDYVEGADDSDAGEEEEESNAGESDMVSTPPLSDTEDEPDASPVEVERVSIKDYQSKHPMFLGRIDTSMSMLQLKHYMYEMEHVSDENKAMVSLCGGRGKIFDGDAIVSDIIATQGNAIFYLKVKGLAGGGWMKTKKHLTKTEAIQKLKQRVVSNVVGDADDDTIVPVPEEIDAYIAKVNGVIQSIILAKAQGTPIFKTGLKQASEQSLKSALEVLTPSGRKGMSEERDSKAIMLLFPSMIEVENTSNAIGKLQRDFMTFVLGITCEAFGVYADGTAKLAVDDLKHAIKMETERRQLALVNSPRDLADAPQGCSIA